MKINRRNLILGGLTGIFGFMVPKGTKETVGDTDKEDELKLLHQKLKETVMLGHRRSAYFNDRPLEITGWGYDTKGKPVPTGYYPCGEITIDNPCGEITLDDKTFVNKKWHCDPVDAIFDKTTGKWVLIEPYRYFTHIKRFHDGTAYIVQTNKNTSENTLVFRDGYKRETHFGYSLEECLHYIRDKAWKEITKEEAELLVTK